MSAAHTGVLLPKKGATSREAAISDAITVAPAMNDNHVRDAGDEGFMGGASQSKACSSARYL
jgi:hypothetical protein